MQVITATSETLTIEEQKPLTELCFLLITIMSFFFDQCSPLVYTTWQLCKGASYKHGTKI